MPSMPASHQLVFSISGIMKTGFSHCACCLPDSHKSKSGLLPDPVGQGKAQDLEL